MKTKLIKFTNFMECREAGRFLVNPFWLEYLLNLFSQEYFSECYEEIMETQINNDEMIKSIAYNTIGESLK